MHQAVENCTLSKTRSQCCKTFEDFEALFPSHNLRNDFGYYNKALHVNIKVAKKSHQTL